MVTATFRFHEELNDFLPRQRREREFSCRCARAATTKHMIEALGVPHTEVGAVLVNKDSVGMDRMLVEGDRVEVFPGIGMASMETRSCPDGSPSRSRQFIADAHLGGLARLLRMAGFDTLYDNRFGDEKIEGVSQRQNRIVLSRDRELLKRRHIRQGCYVHALKPVDQLREIFVRLGLAGEAKPFSICLHCNTPLHAVAKAAVLDRIPESVRMSQEEFSMCDTCHRIYWKGSHWQRMQALMQKMGIPDQ